MFRSRPDKAVLVLRQLGTIPVFQKLRIDAAREFNSQHVAIDARFRGLTTGTHCVEAPQRGVPRSLNTFKAYAV